MQLIGSELIALRPKTVISIGGMSLAALIVAGVIWFVTINREAAIKDSQRELQNLALALSEEGDREFEGAAMIQRNIIESLEMMGVATRTDLRQLASSFEFHKILVEKINNISYIDAVSIIDTKGDLVNFSRSWPIPHVSVADRDYFFAIMQDPHTVNFIGKPVQNRGNGIWTIYLANPVPSKDGGLLGLILVAMKVSYFEDSFASFAMPGGRVTLYRSDGTPLARYPHIAAEYEKSYGSLSIFDRKKNIDAAGNISIESLVDGTPRLLGFSRLRQYPMLVTVSKSISSVLTDWRAVSNVLSVVTAVVVALIAITILVLSRIFDQQRISAATDRARLSAEMALSRMELSGSQAMARHAVRFQIALDSMLHGFCIFDADRRLVACNRRYSQMYDLPERLTKASTSWEEIALYKNEKFGFSGSRPKSMVFMESINQPKSEKEEFSESHTLCDGRTILVCSTPIPEGGWVATHEDVTERCKAEKRLSQLAHYDDLTGLPNRLLFNEKMNNCLLKIENNANLAIFCLDLDRFKDVNDTLGHSFGDALLQEVALRLVDCVQASDTVARMGGDEFAILQYSVESPNDAMALAERIVDRICMPYRIDGHDIEIGVSIGIACAPQHDSVGARLLRKADIALYRAKADGRRGYRFFEEFMDAATQERRTIEIDLRRALEKDEFILYFQPMVDIETRTVRSFEALIRWRHPVRGLISPLDFIPIAEDTGLIIPIGEWVLQSACRHAMSWPPHIRVSVNISVCQFKSPNLVSMVSKTLDATGLTPSRLELEITESVLLHQNEFNFKTLYALHALGTKIVMDDFGTGYSSLNYLRVFPFDKIKIDKSFVQHLDQNSANAIVQAIADLGRRININTTAEGIETEFQFNEIKYLGCTEAQGYLFSRPVSGDQVENILKDLNATRQEEEAA